MRGKFPKTGLHLVASAAAFALAVPVLAEGALDTSFSSDGKRTFGFNDGYAVARAVAAQPDGAIVVGGSVGTAANLTDFAVTRFLPDGGLDSLFGTSGERIVAIDALISGQDDLQALALDAAGRIHLLGTAAASGGARIPALARLTPAGDLDLSFGDQGIVQVASWPWTGQISTVAASGHLGGFVFAGYAFDSPTSASGPFVVRLTASGAIDSAFGDSGWARVGVGLGHLVSALGVDAAGRIYVAAISTNPTPDEVQIYRFTAIGDLDLTYGGGDGVATATPAQDLQPSALALDPVDGSLVVGLRNGLEEAIPTRGAICRFSASGLFDAAFGWVATTYDDGSTIEDLAIQGDRKIVGVGRIDGPGTQLGGLLFVRLLPDGTFDPTFDGNGRIRVEIDLDPDARDGGLGLALHGGRALGVGFAREAGGNQRFAAVRLTTALVFADGFESGLASNWSAIVP